MGERSRQLFQEAGRLFPGGVNSPVRAFRAVAVSRSSWPGPLGAGSPTWTPDLHRLCRVVGGR